MNNESKTVLSTIKQNKKIKKNIIFSDLSRKNFELSKRMMHIFLDYQTTILFYSEKNNHFLDGKKVIENIDEILATASLVFNFVPVKKQISRDLSRKAEKLKVPSVQNNLSTRMIFSAKNNIKKVLKTYGFKTPHFEFIGRKTANEVFFDFIQPSRIFSASNHFFSGKLESLENIQRVYDEVGEDISNYFIEEYVEGKDIYSFVFFKDEQVFTYNIEKKGNNFLKMDSELNKEISEYVKEMFTDFGIEKFALVNLKKNKSRGILVLNIFVDWDILMDKQGKVMTEIFKQESVTESQILKSFL